MPTHELSSSKVAIGLSRWSRRGAICACLGCFAPALAFRAEAATPLAAAPPTALSPAPRPPFVFEQIGPGVFRHTSWSTLSDGSWFPSNSMVVVGARRVLLIDTAWTPDQTRLLLKTLAPLIDGRPMQLFVTHFHADRMGGIGVTAARKIPSSAFSRTVQEAWRHSAGYIEHALRPDHHVFDLGGRTVEAFYPGPGHTVDNSVVFDRTSGILFGGCMMRGDATTDLGNVADADIPHWAGSVARVAARYPEAVLVVPGHGPSGGREIFEHTIMLARAKTDA